MSHNGKSSCRYTITGRPPQKRTIADAGKKSVSQPTLENAFRSASWLLSYHWEHGGSGSTVVTFKDDGTFSTSQGGSGKWVQRPGDTRAFFAFSSGSSPDWSVVYSLTLAGDGRSFSGIQGWSHTSGQPQKGTHTAVRTRFVEQPASLRALLPGGAELSADGSQIDPDE